MKISEQTDHWVTQLRQSGQNAAVLSLVAGSQDETALAEALDKMSQSLYKLADEIHARFVAPSIGKPPVTRTRKVKVV